MLVDLGSNPFANLRKRVVRRHVRNARAVGITRENTQVRREDDKSLGEIHTVSAPRRQHAVVEDLQKLV